MYVMFTRQAAVPSWIASAFQDSGVTGKWRDNNLRLVDYQLYKRTCKAGETLKLGGPPLDFVTLVKPAADRK